MSGNSMVDSSNTADLGNILAFNERVDAFTPEDIAWVDSCLIKEIPDISDSNWNNMKDALLEILNLHPQKFDSFAAASDNFQGSIIDTDMLLSDKDGPPFPTGSSDDIVSMSEDIVSLNESGIATDDTQDDDNIETFPSYPFRGNPFLPTYNDDVHGRESFQTGPSLDLSETESYPSSNDIFRVWDLNLPAVEDELVEQLNKVLPENSVQSVPSVVDDLKVMPENSIQSVPSMVGDFSGSEDFDEDILDLLVNSISDLCLE